MNFSRYYSEQFARVYVARDAAGFPAVDRCRAGLPDAPFTLVDDQRDIPQEHLRSSTLYLSLPRGEVFGRCPGTHGHLCCNYNTLDLYLGCTLGCSYCIMRSYLNFSPVTVYVDPQPGIDAVLRAAAANPGRQLRIGTGEVGDSLQLDPLFRLSEEYITAFSGSRNVTFEMKTKTAFVDHLLSLPKKGNAVTGFSLSPAQAAEAEDGASSPINARLAAADRASRAGYALAFHFDPIILTPEWRNDMELLVAQLRRFSARRIAWISMGTIRFPAGHRDLLADRLYMYQEYIPCRDGKFRYLQKERISAYRFLRERLQTLTDAPVYLCMESLAVWKAVYRCGPMESRARDLFVPLHGVDRHQRTPQTADAAAAFRGGYR